VRAGGRAGGLPTPRCALPPLTPTPTPGAGPPPRPAPPRPCRRSTQRSSADAGTGAAGGFVKRRRTTYSVKPPPRAALPPPAMLRHPFHLIGLHTPRGGAPGAAKAAARLARRLARPPARRSAQPGAGGSPWRRLRRRGGRTAGPRGLGGASCVGGRPGGVARHMAGALLCSLWVGPEARLPCAAARRLPSGACFIGLRRARTRGSRGGVSTPPRSAPRPRGPAPPPAPGPCPGVTPPARPAAAIGARSRAPRRASLRPGAPGQGLPPLALSRMSAGRQWRRPLPRHPPPPLPARGRTPGHSAVPWSHSIGPWRPPLGQSRTRAPPQ
jgi:hypothetical protein